MLVVLGPCRLWHGPFTEKGYPILRGARRGRGPVYVHVVVYEVFYGPIPPGMTVDHVCRTRGCVEPLHLELATRSENTRRGMAGRHPRSPFCPKGHLYDAGDLTLLAEPGVDRGRRWCRTCKKEATRARRAKHQRVL